MFRFKKDEGSCRIENETAEGFSVVSLKAFARAERNNNTYGISNPDMRSISLSPIAEHYFGLVPCWSVAQCQQIVLQLPRPTLRKNATTCISCSKRMAAALLLLTDAMHRTSTRRQGVLEKESGNNFQRKRES